MRLGVAVVFVALAGSVAVAEDAKPSDPPPPAPVKAKVPLRVVRMLPETHQALLFDKEHDTHVLADVGGTVDGFKVEDIDDDEVTLEGSAGEIVLTAPPAWRHADDRPGRQRPALHDARVERREASAEPKAEPQPEDPYAEPEVRTVEAPPRVTVDPTPSPSPVAAPAPDPAPTVAVDDVPTTPVATTIPRGEMRAAMSNFGKLAGTIRCAFVADGLKVDGVSDGSLFARVGLRAGDVVRAVDNQPLRSIDDAADLYARAGTARNITIQVVRGGKPLTLRVAIQ